MNTYYITGRKEWKRRQWPYIITSATIAWQNVSVPTKDLMLFDESEGAKASLKCILDYYRYPYELMANKANAMVQNIDKNLNV